MKMAEYCIDCVNEIFNTNYKSKHFILSYDTCEKCGRYTKTVVIEKRIFYTRLLTILFFPIIIAVLILALPYYLMKHIVNIINKFK